MPIIGARVDPLASREKETVMLKSAVAAARPRRTFVALVIATVLGFAAVAKADDGTVVVDDLSFEVGIVKYTIRHLEASGTSMSATGIKTLFSRLGTPDAAGQLAQLEANSIVIPEITLEQTIGQNTTTTHYHDVKLSDVHAGKVGAYSIATGEFTGAITTGQSLQGTIHGIAGTDIDLPNLIRVYTQADADASAPLKLLYGSAAIDGMSFKTPMVEMSFGKSVMSDIRGRPLSRPLADILAQMPPQPRPGEPPSPEAQKAAMAFLVSVIGIYGAFSVDKTEMHDVKIIATGDPDKQMTFSTSIARITMTDYANSRIGEMDFDGLDVTPPMGKFHLGRFLVKGFDFRDWLASLSQIMQQIAADPAAAQIAASQMRSPKVEDLSVSDFVADFIPPAQPSDPNPQPQPMHMALTNFDLRPVLAANGLPKSFSSTVDHFVFSLPPNIPDSEALAAAGFDKIDISCKLDAQWDEATQRLTIATATLEGANLGKLSIAATADNIPPEAFNGDQFMRQAAWLGALIKSADIRLDNDKLLGIVLAGQAKQMDKTVDEARSELITAAAMGIPALLGNSPAVKVLGDAVAKFLADPKSLHVALNSKDGIGAGDIAAPEQILDKMELKATANE